MSTTTKLPYVVQPTLVPRILEKVKQAQTPDRFTQDYLSTKLGFRGGNPRQFISIAKKLGLLGADGRPTALYKQFRNPSQSGAAIAEAMKIGYRELFERNEYANNLPKDQLKGLIVEITGLDANDRVVQLTAQTFELIKKLADFDATLGTGTPSIADEDLYEDDAEREDNGRGPASRVVRGAGREVVGRLNLAYTINLVLPKSDDPAVFNAIFKALRENLLRN